MAVLSIYRQGNSSHITRYSETFPINNKYVFDQWSMVDKWEAGIWSCDLRASERPKKNTCEGTSDKHTEKQTNRQTLRLLVKIDGINTKTNLIYMNLGQHLILVIHPSVYLFCIILIQILWYWAKHRKYVFVVYWKSFLISCDMWRVSLSINNTNLKLPYDHPIKTFLYSKLED